MTSFETIIFDLDGTLIDETDCIELAFNAAASHAQAHHDLDIRVFARTARATAQQVWWQPDWLGPLTKRYGLSSWDGLSEAFTGTALDLEPLRRWLPVYRRQTWAATYASLGVRATEQLVDQTTHAFIQARHACAVRPLPGAVQLLDRYADRKLIILTNGPADGQQRKINVSGLGDRVHAVIASTAAGTGKPDPAVVQAALAAVNARTPHTIIIGDSYERDIQAALNCGMPAIWIAGNSAPFHAVHGPITVVSTTAEVDAALSELESRL